MNLKISQKLLILFLLVTGMVAGQIWLLSTYNISSGFSSYVAQSELGSLDTIPSVLQNAYGREGSWDKVFADPQVMDKAFAINEDLHRPRPEEGIQDPHHPGPPIATRPPGGAGADGPPEREMGPPQGMNPPVPPDAMLERPPYPPFRVELFHRIGVFDQNGKLLWGNQKAKDSKAAMPIMLKNVQVGTFNVAASETHNRDIENNFLAEQNRSMLFVCLFAVVLAALSAKLMSKHFVDAIELLVKETRRLIAGEWSSRIELIRSDELGQLAQDLNSLATVLEQHDRAHKQWITDTSHELRTPVAVLRAQVEALQDGVQEPNQKTLAVLHDQVMILGKLVDDLHDLAKSDLNQLKFVSVPTDVGAVLHDCLESFEDKFASKNIALDMGNVAKLKTIVPADPLRIKQLFNNLLENSLRYTNEGGKTQLSSGEDNDYLTICIDDTDPGVPDELLQHIFERFYRIESSRSRMYGGTGLGLAICKTIVEGHGGSIKAMPSTLGGLKIEVKLPLKSEGVK